MKTEEGDLERRVVLGLDTEALLASNVGRYLVQRADEEIENARLALESVDPDNPKAIRDLQFVIAVARATMSWMQEAIAEGKNAEEQLASRDHTE